MQPKVAHRLRGNFRTTAAATSTPSSVIPGATTSTLRDRTSKQNLKAQQQLHRFHIPRQLGTKRVRCASIRMRALKATHAYSVPVCTSPSMLERSAVGHPRRGRTSLDTTKRRNVWVQRDPENVWEHSSQKGKGPFRQDPRNLVWPEAGPCSAQHTSTSLGSHVPILRNVSC